MHATRTIRGIDGPHPRLAKPVTRSGSRAGWRSAATIAFVCVVEAILVLGLVLGTTGVGSEQRSATPSASRDFAPRPTPQPGFGD